MNYDSQLSPHAAATADAPMVCRMRLLLSVSTLLTLFIDPETMGRQSAFTWLVFSGYTLHSVVLYLLAMLEQAMPQNMLIYWLDVFWYALIVFFTGGGNLYFLFFFFAILTASFQWGFEEGARITLASAGLFAATALLAATEAEVSRLLLRTTFLLALGYMIAYWGGSAVAQKRHLALLRDVSQLSNPRFGVEHTIASVLEKTRVFFKARSCILLMRDSESAAWSLRTAMGQNAGLTSNATRIGDEAAAPLLAFGAEQVVLFARPLWPGMDGATRVLDNTLGRWLRRDDDAGASLAELLEARSFICAPLPLRNGAGRIYVASANAFSKSDALFLSHIGAQAFPVIENIELLDRLASQAALREREKIARDLHDTTIQPYIGLRHGISALRHKAAPDNPLIGDLDRLLSMATQVIGDLRQFARTFKNGLVQSEPELLVALRRQAAQIREFYGIDIALGVAGELDMSDRLAAEVFQIVNEGMSNIRKHSDARRGSVELNCANGALSIRIDNECLNGPVGAFTPNSMAERAAALGGRARVVQTSKGITSVQIEIPI
ncbi:histidine kinase [Janthinobacterium fluminis]|uniref:histidine kinase n=1 Tax=Janthinobacterium fluminis TaxID=2987524 RepID=A0ABT5K3H6_9BURK|nr:histidine kinase [Janthinobacterium fluminis]MDC8759240.1 histidine kinase [Janthinobacterium fluminis]